jgi:hypothetical protein
VGQEQKKKFRGFLGPMGSGISKLNKKAANWAISKTAMGKDLKKSEMAGNYAQNALE